jgi:ribonuclease HI
MTDYTICADGACSGNPGPGGWAFEVWVDDAVIETQSGCSPATTNNIMELEAAIRAVTFLVEGSLATGVVRLRFDSEYVLKGIFEWMAGWKARGWKTAAKKPVANAAMWQELDSLIEQAKASGFTFVSDWVKGHDGDIGNERVDTLAATRRDEAKARASENAAIDTHVEAALATRTEAIATASGEVTPDQVDALRQILDGYVSGDTSVKGVLAELRKNAQVLGL